MKFIICTQWQETLLYWYIRIYFKTGDNHKTFRYIYAIVVEKQHFQI